MNVPPDRVHELVLEHVARYRLSLRATLVRVFMAGDKTRTDGVIRALREEGLLTSRSLGRLSYYQITSAGARRLGVPSERAEAMGPAKIETALAVLWFCCMQERRRSRLDTAHLGKLLGEKSIKALRQGIYCLDRRREGRRLLRIQIVTEQSSNRHMLSRIRYDRSRVAEHPVLRDYLAAKSYAQVVLAPSFERKTSVITALEGAGLWGRGAQGEIVVEDYPPPAQLETALRERAEGSRR